MCERQVEKSHSFVWYLNKNTLSYIAMLRHFVSVCFEEDLVQLVNMPIIMMTQLRSLDDGDLTY